MKVIIGSRQCNREEQQSVSDIVLIMQSNLTMGNIDLRY